MKRDKRIDPAHSAWVENATAVAADPTMASVQMLKDAIAYLQYRRAIAWKKQPRAEKTVAELDARIAAYVMLLDGQTRDRPGGAVASEVP